MKPEPIWGNDAFIALSAYSLQFCEPVGRDTMAACYWELASRSSLETFVFMQKEIGSAPFDSILFAQLARSNCQWHRGGVLNAAP